MSGGASCGGVPTEAAIRWHMRRKLEKIGAKIKREDVRCLENAGTARNGDPPGRGGGGVACQGRRTKKLYCRSDDSEEVIHKRECANRVRCRGGSAI